MSNKDQPLPKDEPQRRNKKKNLWPLKVFFIALSLSIVFSTFSQIALTGTNIIIAIIVLVAFTALGLLADMIGTAVTVCELTPFLSMASRKIHGAKMSIWLVNRQAAVSSICNDIIGDICAIVCGAIGVSISLQIKTTSDILSFLIPILISGLIAAVTISGKAITKLTALKHSHSIIKVTGLVLSGFGQKKKSK